ncbi:hypothetical protein DC522_19360 [Microvirga sp. KLBC 81]|uniref:hypothetical protein n=1 Tax=Microvirga sp. KLBC 81 TaxID=1862707 RepID=UPI000D513A9E|nr:hypothetical protein [Microvirga sp. KLBC 81]PVE22797.1 hypothetical protein DC522_19360 [Microvirga sp. KLBC 81]
MARPRLLILPLLQAWEPATASLRVNVLLLPDTHPRKPLSDGWGTPIPPAPSFEGATLSLQAGFSSDLDTLPTLIAIDLTAHRFSLQPPAEQEAILDELETRFPITLPPKAHVPSAATRLGKYLPESYRGAFAFVSPRTSLAFVDDRYHCALRCRPKGPPPVPRTPALSWPEAIAFALRHPKLARSLGLIHSVTVPVGTTFENGGWLCLPLGAGSTFTDQLAADGEFVRTYATRVPKLVPGEARAVFTPTLFPVMPNAAAIAGLGNFDQALREAAVYDDGFTRIVHASQPRTRDPIEESEDGTPPVEDLGLAVGWDDEDILLAQNRAIGLEPDGSTPAPAPHAVVGYRVDVSRDDDPTWRSLCRVHAPTQTFGPVTLGDLDWELPFEVHPRKVNEQLYLPIMFAQWRGRSLVASSQEERRLQGIDKDPTSGNHPAGLENVRLRWGEHYRLRVRLADLSGGGPGENDEPDSPVQTQVARWHFRRFVPPGAPRIVASGNVVPLTQFSISRPTLGFPEATFTAIPNAFDTLVAQMQAAIAAGEAVRPRLPDSDAEALEIAVFVRAPGFDPSGDRDGFRLLYSTYRAFPSSASAPLSLGLSFVDCARLSGRSWEAMPAFPGPAAGAIEIPTARDVRIRVRCVARNDPEYFGNDAARTGAWSDLSPPVRAQATAEPPLFAPVIQEDALASIFLQPDSSLLAPNADAAPQAVPWAQLASRFAAAASVVEDRGTLLSNSGRRAVFGCSGLKHHLPPDRSSLTITTPAELPGRWLNVIRLSIDRDWTWQGLDAPALVVRRTLRAVGAAGTPPLSEQLMTVVMQHAVNGQATRGEVDRESTDVIVVDAFEPLLVAGLPYEIEVTYEVEARLADGRTENAMLANRLPVATPPAQTPKVVSVGHAFSDYQIGENYSHTGHRLRRLWIEFAEPPIDPRDGYFVRVVSHAPDPMLLRSSQPADQAIAFNSPALDPELVRVIRPGQSDDFAGLHAMQPLESSGTCRHFLVPLPPNLPPDAGELFGFFTYEICVGHRARTPGSPFWSTARGRFGASLMLEGVQHPPPHSDCEARWIGDDLVGSSTFAEAVIGSGRVTADPPNTEVWMMLYCQVLQADGAAHRNILLGRKRVQLRRRERALRVEGTPRWPAGYTSWSENEIRHQLTTLGLPEDMPLSVLAVEMLPEPNAAFDDPLGGDLGEVRILRSSPLVAVEARC